jgi:hypothetical protein
MTFTEALKRFAVALQGRKPEQPTEYKMDPATITLIISGLVTLIKMCRDEDPEVNDDVLVSRARGAAGVRAIRKSARKAGLRGRRFRNAVRESVDELRNMSDDEIKEEFVNAPEMEQDEDGNDGIDYDLFK